MPASFVTVTREESGQKLVRFLERRVGDSVPRSAIMRWIRKGDVRVDKGRKKPFDLVKEGQSVRIPPYKSTSSEKNIRSASAQPLKIIYEDNDILAVYKPCGLPSQDGSGHDDSVASRLKSIYADKVFTPAPAHRLDRDTSGVLLCGKSHTGLKALSEAFQRRETDKFYLTEVAGRFDEKDWIVVHDRMEKKGSSGREKVQTGSGKEALALVRTVRCAPNSLLLIKLMTGRTHQIRVQLASRGYPVLGDAKYGKKYHDSIMRLHCWRIKACGIDVSCMPEWGEVDDNFLADLIKEI